MVKERLSTAKKLAFIAPSEGHGDGASAARDAGYRPKGAERFAWELLNKPAFRDQALEKKRSNSPESSWG